MTPRAVLEKLAAIQIVDALLSNTEGRELTLSRYSAPDAYQRLLLTKLKLQLSKKPPRRITSSAPISLPVEVAL